MFHLLLCPILLASSQPPAELKTRVARASIFKPGIVMVVREADVPAGKGEYKLDVMPEALDGSFWFGSSDGLRLDEVRTQFHLVDKVVSRPATTIADYLEANNGRNVRVRVIAGQKDAEWLEGTLVSQTPPTGEMLLKLENGTARRLTIGEVVEIDTHGLEGTLTRKAKMPEVSVRFSVDSPRASHVQFVTLEGGAAWFASYMLELSGQEQGRLTGKAQVAVGPLRFEDTLVSAVSGLPSLPEANKYDLASGFGSLTAYLSGNQEAYRTYLDFARDPFSDLPAYLQAARQALNPQWNGYYGYPGGGFGGGGFGGVGAFARSGDPSGGMDLDRNDRRPSNPTVNRVDTLFAYPLGKVSMEPGERLTRIMFEQDAKVHSLFTVHDEIPTGGPSEEVQTPHSVLRLTNKGKVPWTEGKVLVVRGETPLAELGLPFTPVGQDADLVIGDVQDLVVRVKVEETARTPISDNRRIPALVEISQRVTVTLLNARPETADLEIAETIYGEVIEAVGAETRKRLAVNDRYNPKTDVQYHLMLKPQEKRELTFTFKRIV